MRFYGGMAALMIGLVGAAPAHAQTPPAPAAGPDIQLEALLGPGALLGGMLTERDVSLLMEHLRAALIAAAAGRDAPPPAALNRRAEEIAAELRIRGTLAGLLLLDALEARARQWVRESPASAVPPARP